MNIEKRELNIAKNYAKALLKITKVQNSSEEIYSQMKELVEIINKSNELKSFLENPLVSSDDKKDIIYKVFGKDFDLQIINLLNLLADNKRLHLTETILYCYEKLYEKINSISKVTIISAVDIPENSKKRLKSVLEQKLKGDIIPNYQINNDIIGGLVIKIEDKVVDLSLKSKIKNMEKQLI